MEAPELKRFYAAIQNLREVMEGDLPLNDFDRVCLENYIALLQIISEQLKITGLRTKLPPEAPPSQYLSHKVD